MGYNMAIFKVALVQFCDSSKDYETSVNIDSTNKEITEYFLNKCFNFGGMRYNHETDQETEIDDLHECLGVEISQPFCKVISGSFEGASGYIVGKFQEGCYFLQCEKTTNKLMVTVSQLDQIYI